MIDKANVQDIYTLSPSQEGILFHYMLNPEDKSEYAIQLLLGIDGDFDIALFEDSVDALIKKYDVLRSVFLSEQVKKPVQIVMKCREKEVVVQDISDQEQEIQKKTVEEYMEKDRIRSFDLSEDLLIRFHVFALGSKQVKILMTMHHIIIDGWSYNIIINDLLQTYRDKINHQEVHREVVVPYRRYIDWVKEQDTSAAEQYWSNYLSGFEGKVYGQEENREYRKAEYEFVLDRETTSGLKELAVDWKVTVSTLVQAIWGVQYSKLNNKQDIIFGTVSSGRQNGLSDVQKMVGLLINTLPVRVQYELEDSFKEIAQKMQKHMFDLMKYDFLPLNKVKAYVTNEDIFEHIIAFENYPLELSKFTREYGYGFDVAECIVDERTNYPINLVVFPGEELHFRFIYNSNLLEKEQILANITYYQRILGQILAEPDVQMKQIRLLSKTEEQTLLQRSYCDTDYVKGKTVDDLIAETAERNQHKVAVVFRNRSYTYKELNERIEKYAAQLKKLSNGKRMIAGVMIERSIDSIVAMLAVVKAGMAYLPIESSQPFLRIKEIITGSQAQLLISTHKDVEACFQENVTYETDVDGTKHFHMEEGNEIQLTFFEDFDFDKATMPEKTATVNKPEDLLYIIYTSGSTGKPKGAMVSHQNLVRLILNNPDPFQFGEDDVWSAFHSFCFDFSVWEMYGALLRGARLYIVNKEETKDFTLLHNAMEREQITVLSMTPTAFINFIQEDMNHDTADFALRYVVFGGEVLHPSKLKEFQLKYPNIVFVNGYGVTETTVLSTYKMLSQEDMDLDINCIGTSLPTTSVYIMDPALNLLPDGVTGEICIGGLGVGLGYLNRPDLTEARFVKNPYLDEMIYRSGDLGRYLENGDLQYFGRMDHQVKIRGFRIEIPEIEKNLMLYPDIREVVVLPIERHEVMSLAAFILSDIELTIEELRNFLEGKLPEYMIPSYFMVMKQFPMNNSGKVERNKLKEMNLQMNANQKKQEPVTEEEKILVAIWEEILETEDIGIEDNFFYLGGDSIKAIQVASRLKKYGYKLVIKDLFSHPIIKDVSKYLKSADGTSQESNTKGEFGLLPIQTWFFENQKESLDHYNQIMGMQIHRKLDADIMKKVVGKIIKNHDALRMVFQVNAARIGASQQIKEYTGNEVILEYADLSGSNQFEADVNALLSQVQSNISIKENKLFITVLVHGKNMDFVYFVVHHLIIDAVSFRVILGEVAQLYSQVEQEKETSLEKEEFSYKAWVEKVEVYATSGKVMADKTYWDAIVDEGRRRDLFRKETGTMRQTAFYTAELPEMSTKLLMTEIHKAYNTEVKDIMIAALGMAYSNMGEKERVLIQLEGHGREEIEEGISIGQTVGWFTTMYPFLVPTDKLTDIGKYIKSVKEDLRNIPMKGFSYGVLRYIEHNWEDLDLAVPVSFNYLGQFSKQIGEFEFAEVKIDNSVGEEAVRIAEIGINCMVRDGRLLITVDYNKDLYMNKEIEEYTQRFIDAIEILSEHCLGVEQTQFTPHDLGSSDLTIDELELLQNELDDIDL